MATIKFDIKTIKTAAKQMKSALRHLQDASKSIPPSLWEEMSAILDANAKNRFFEMINGLQLSRSRIKEKRRLVSRRTVLKRSPSVSLPASAVFPWGKLTGYLFSIFTTYPIGSTGLATRQLGPSGSVKSGYFVYGMDMSRTIGDPDRLVQGYPLELLGVDKAFDVNSSPFTAVYSVSPSAVKKSMQMVMDGWMTKMDGAFKP